MEKTALAEAEVEYHDHTSHTIWVRFPVVRPAHPELQDAALVIWTTTPWTIPGNRAIAAGAAFDYAVIHVDAVEPNAPGRVGEKLVVALELAPQFVKDVGIATHHVAHVFKGAELVGTICAHPLRGRGYDFDVPLLLGDFVTTEAGTGLVHIAPNAGEDDFVLGREHGLEVADTVGDDGTFNAWVPLFAGSTSTRRRSGRRGDRCGGRPAGSRQAGALLPAFLAFQGAADLSRHAELVHPPGRPGAHPREGAGRDREDAFCTRAGPQPAGLDGGQPSRLVHQPPARLGRADRGVRRQAHRRAAARSRGGGAHRRGIQGRGRR